MKSKRRHELQTNELADRLGVWIEKVRPHLATAGLVVLAVVAVVFVYYYWSSSKEELATQSWRRYIQTTWMRSGVGVDVVKDLNRVADAFSDTEAGMWAAMTSADFEAGEGVNLLFSAKELAVDHLLNSIKGYRSVLASDIAKDHEMMQVRAHLGLAQANEAYWAYDDDYQIKEESGKIKLNCREEAEKHYKAIVEINKDSVLAKFAQERLERMGRASTQEFYTWMQTQEPIAASSLRPEDDLGLPGGNLDNLPGSPNFDFLNDGTEDGKSTEKTPAVEVEAEDSKTPAVDGTDTSKKTPAVEGPDLGGPAIDPPAGKEETAGSTEEKKAP